MKVVVVDSHVGNLGAIPNMLAKAGSAATITDDPSEIEDADRIVLPGVGSFDAAMRNLTAAGVLDVLRSKVIEQGTPLLGLCLGMEILADRSEEGALGGLGWIPGDVRKFDFGSVAEAPRVPHMGWNIVRPERDSAILRDLGDRPRFYFAHSYYFEPARHEDVLATTEYGRPFASVVQRDNITGIQFHPEKSHRFGLAIFRNFVRG
jgi:glutamine amidotransferase